MKKLVLAAGLMLLSCSPVPAQEPELEYKTLFIATWVYSCANKMQQNFLQLGMPQQLALQEAIRKCSCVIDHFRRDFSHSQLITMHEEDRLAYSNGYSAQCFNVEIM